MSRMFRRALLGMALGIALYAVAVVYVDAERVHEALGAYRWSALVGALLLSSGNYLLRFVKWEICLAVLEVRREVPSLTRRRSLAIYLAGLAMSVTPGKIGEVLRSSLLKTTDGVPFARTAPIVVADRLTDVVGLVVLSLLGIARFREYLPVVITALGLVVAGLVVLGNRRLLHASLRLFALVPGLRRLHARADLLTTSSAELLRPAPLVLLSLLSVVGWGLECLGYFWVLHGFAGHDTSLALSTFLWATTTLIGALSLLPGGLGATEGSLTVLVTRLSAGITQPVALASTLLIRAATLWYGALVGAIALGVVLRNPSVRARAIAERSEGAPAT